MCLCVNKQKWNGLSLWVMIRCTGCAAINLILLKWPFIYGVFQNALQLPQEYWITSWSMLLYMFEMFAIVSVCSTAAFSCHLVVGRHLFSKCILLDLPLFRLFTRPEAWVYTYMYMINCHSVYMYWASYTTNSISFICNLSIKILQRLIRR